MTHDHAVDLEIVDEALQPTRFDFVGLIGSATKRAQFSSQMRGGWPAGGLFLRGWSADRLARVKSGAGDDRRGDQAPLLLVAEVARRGA